MYYAGRIYGGMLVEYMVGLEATSFDKTSMIHSTSIKY